MSRLTVNNHTGGIVTVIFQRRDTEVWRLWNDQEAATWSTTLPFSIEGDPINCADDKSTTCCCRPRLKKGRLYYVITLCHSREPRGEVRVDWKWEGDALIFDLY